MVEPVKSRAGCILTVDVGTTSVKVSLFDRTLRLKRMTAREYALDSKPGGIVEVDPEIYIRSVREGIADMMVKSDAGESVAAVAVTTQGETLIPVDAAGKPLCNAIVWLDARAGAEAQALSGLIGADVFYRTTGLPEISASLPLAKLLYIRQSMPYIYRKTHKFLLLEDYILHWLTGRFVTEKSILCSTGYFDIMNDDYWALAMDAAGFDKSVFPEALACGETVGPLLHERADELGLPRGTLAVTGAMDQTAAALGAGCVSDGIVTETTGTALVAAAYTRKPRFTHPSRVTVYRHALDGAFLYLPIGITAGMALKWFRDCFCPDIASGDAEGSDYETMSAMASSVPAGSGGLLVLPHLAGCLNPDYEPGARMVMFGAGLETTRAHFIRAIMEAVAYMLKDFTAMLHELGGGVTEIRSLGGGSRSGLWQQIKADAVGLSFATMDLPEAASAGAALLAAWGLGWAPRNSVLQVMRPERRHMPDAANEETYRRCYARYKALYQSVKPLFKENGVNCDA